MLILRQTTVALDVRALHLGIRAIDVQIGDTPRQLLSDGWLGQELIHLGRHGSRLSCIINAQPPACDVSFDVDSESLTIVKCGGDDEAGVQLLTDHVPRTASAVRSNRWHRQTHAASPMDAGLERRPDHPSDVAEGGPDCWFTVFDRVHHMRVLPARMGASFTELVARALQLTPELAFAEGHLLARIVPGAPQPQIALADADPNLVTVPVQYLAAPIAVCTVSVAKDSTAFQIAYAASNSCHNLNGVHRQIAKGTATLSGSKGYADPFQPSCVGGHEAVELLGFVLAGHGPKKGAHGSHLPPYLMSREVEPHCDVREGDNEDILVFQARAATVTVQLDPTCTLTAARMSLLAGNGQGSVRWPALRPALPSFAAAAVVVPESALQESPRWAMTDLRRVLHPPLLPLQLIPIPEFMDEQTAIKVIQREFPSLAAVPHIYMDSSILDEQPRLAGTVVLLTIVPRHDSVNEPELDDNIDLLHMRPGFLASLETYRAVDWKGRPQMGAASASSSSSVASDCPQAFPSSGESSAPEDACPAPFLQQGRPSTTSTTTTAAPAQPSHLGLLRMQLAMAAPGRKPRAMYFSLRDDFARVLGKLLFDLFFQDRGLLRNTLRFCPRIYYKATGEPMLFATLESDDGFEVSTWIDARCHWHRLFVTRLPWKLEVSGLLDAVGLQLDGHTAPLVYVNGARVRDVLHLYEGCVVTLCSAGSSMHTQPLTRLAAQYEPLRCLCRPLPIPPVPEGGNPLSASFQQSLSKAMQDSIACLDLESWSTTAIVASPDFGATVIATGRRLPADASTISLRAHQLWPGIDGIHVTDCRDMFLDSCVYLTRSSSANVCYWFHAVDDPPNMFVLESDVEPEFGIPAPAGFHAIVVRRAPGWGIFKWHPDGSREVVPSVTDQLDAMDLSPVPSYSSMFDSPPVENDESESASGSSSSSDCSMSTSEGTAFIQTSARIHLSRSKADADKVGITTVPTPCRSRRPSRDVTNTVGSAAPPVACSDNGEHEASSFVVEETTPHVVSFGSVQGGSRAAYTAESGRAPAPTGEPAGGAGGGRPVCIVKLEDCIPPQPVACRSLRVPASVEALYTLIQPLAPAVYRTSFLQLPDVHQATKLALAGMEVWDWRETPSSVDLYVDGSFFERTGDAAWAVVLVPQCQGRSFWGGFISGQLFEPCHALFAGQTVVNPHTAELVALLYAMATCCNLEGVQCRILYDAQSAAAVADATARSKSQPVLARALLGLRHLCSLQCAGLEFAYVAAHEGHAFNEAADTAAKAAARNLVLQQPQSAALMEAVRNGSLDWLWWVASPYCHEGCLPGLDDDGLLLQPDAGILARKHDCTTLPGIPSMVAADKSQRAQSMHWCLHVATYNCTTLRKEHDRQSLCHSFQQDFLHVVGMQETRTDPGRKTKQGPYCCLCSAAEQGQLGCQLWLHTGIPFASASTEQKAFLVESSVAIIASSPRLLVVTAVAGSQMFAFIVGHAPISDAAAAERESWWERLDQASRQIPRRAIPIWLLDANARFKGGTSDTASGASCVEDNARAMQAFMLEHRLESNALYHQNGAPVESWVSPAGKKCLIDYVLFPYEFQDAASTVGCPPRFMDPLGFDHSPVMVSLRWKQLGQPSSAAWRWNREAMKTPLGRQRLEHVFKSCPSIPWQLHPDDHLQLINDHVCKGLQMYFPPTPCQSRRRHVSPELWEAVRLRRYARRLVFRNKASLRRHLIHLVFGIWKRTGRTGGQGCTVGVDGRYTRWARFERTARLTNARLAQVIRATSQAICKFDARDAAAHTKEVLRTARNEGPGPMAHALRQVLKQGRRYKAPRVAPVLYVNGVIEADPETVTQLMEDAFAKPEGGQRTTIKHVATCAHGLFPSWQQLSAADLPSLSQVTEAFLSMQGGKAPGLSTFPAEVYKHGALSAAQLHMPLIVKSAVAGVLPVLWRGSLAVAIPKPAKPMGTTAAWRNIALFDAAAKGMGRALRQQLAKHLRGHALDGQNGTLKGDNLLIPSHAVQTYLQVGAVQQKCCAILFMDGRNAYYSVLRQVLSCQSSEDLHFLEETFKQLGFDDEQQLHLLALLHDGGEFEVAGVPSTLQTFLRTCLSGTWFTMFNGCDAHDVIHTKSGTVPGTPLADILFAFVQARFQRSLQQEMAECNLNTTFAGRRNTLVMPSWADDVSVLLPLCHCDELESIVSKAVIAAENHSRATGICLNFEPGKTEVLCAVRGPGSRMLRRRLLSADEPGITVTLTNHQEVRIRLVQQYVHLGSTVSFSGHTVADSKTKPC